MLVKGATGRPLSTQCENDLLIVIWQLEAGWRMHVSMNWAIIDSGNGVWPMRDQVIIWINGNLLMIGPLGRPNVKCQYSFQSILSIPRLMC